MPDGLDRIARRPDGSVVVGRREPGRGAWICGGSAECFEQAVRRGALARALRTALETDVIEALRARLYGGSEQRTP
jgi:predicted RNA-binding protein YlxR (DUF448 family)